MGGTFDPIHLGHLRAAESARETLGLDQVMFVPAGLPPHRTGPVSTALDRFAMASLATAGHPAFVVSDMELRRAGPSYTADTLSTLADERPGDSLVLVVGSDAFGEMAGWKNPDRIFRLCTVAVVSRPGSGMEAVASPGEGAFRRARITRIEAPAIPISATDIRRRVLEGRSIRYLVADAVADFIVKRGLYR